MDINLLLKKLDKKEGVVSAYEASIENGYRAKLKRILILRHKLIKYFYTKYIDNSYEVISPVVYERNLVLPLIDTNARSLYFFGTLAVEEYPLTKFLLKKLKTDDVFYDIGANFGFYTFLATQIINEDKGEIHTFEPNPLCFSSLEKSKKYNGTKNVVLNQLGVYHTDAERSFYGRDVSFYHGSAGYSLVSDAAPEKNYKEIAKVKTVSLDTYITKHKVPTVIKVDVEGGELAVLNGAQKLLTTYSPIVIMEVWSKEKGLQFSSDSVEKIISLGYVPHKISPDGEIIPIHFQEIFDFDFEFNNFVFIKNA